jgi:hypothetical protein
MKKLIVDEVASFRDVVRAQARGAGQVRRQDKFVFGSDVTLIPFILLYFSCSLPIPSRDEILNSPVQEHGPVHGATSSYTALDRQTSSPVMDEPSEQLERELAGTRFPGQN